MSARSSLVVVYHLDRLLQCRLPSYETVVQCRRPYLLCALSLSRYQPENQLVSGLKSNASWYELMREHIWGLPVGLPHSCYLDRFLLQRGGWSTPTRPPSTWSRVSGDPKLPQPLRCIDLPRYLQFTIRNNVLSSHDK